MNVYGVEPKQLIPRKPQQTSSFQILNSTR